MAPRSKKAKRRTAWFPWDADWASILIAPSTWTPPARVKVSHGARAGTVTAMFKDEGGNRSEAYARISFNADFSKIVVTETGIRATYCWSVKGGAK